jgi:hypothetical protein
MIDDERKKTIVITRKKVQRLSTLPTPLIRTCHETELKIIADRRKS